MNQDYFLTCHQLLEQGEYAKAKTGFEFILMCNPTSFEAFRGIASCELGLKNWRKAIVACINALGHGGNKQDDLSRLLLILETSELLTYIPDLEASLLLAAQDKFLAFRARKQLWQQVKNKHETVLFNPQFSLNAQTIELLKDRMFCHLISNSVLANYQIESLMLWCRHEILLLAVSGNDIQTYRLFLSSFICLSLLNDGLYFTSDEEKALLYQLSQRNSCLEHVLLQLCYADINTAISIWQDNQDLFKGPEVKSLVEDLKFYTLVMTTQSSVFLKDKTSQLVQSFYIENPYPKWKIIDFLEFKVDRVFQNINLKFEPACQILSAGCGTGQQVINLALHNPQAKITAIDLSPISLAYCKEMALKFELTNIEFELLDILEIEKLTQSFDFIICTGVLHHMADPQLGLTKLESVLKPEGLMLLAFYSKTARASLLDIKKSILSFCGVNDELVSRNDVRLWRSQLTTEQKNNYPKLYDLFYLNGLYDLLFHPQQFEYELLELDKMIKECHLTFECMEVDNNATTKYKEIIGSFPTLRGNITEWQKIEQQFPGTFIGMYNFFVTKHIA